MVIGDPYHRDGDPLSRSLSLVTYIHFMLVFYANSELRLCNPHLLLLLLNPTGVLSGVGMARDFGAREPQR